MQYIDLVNLAIEESGSELNQLTLLTWDSSEAGRRIYPRIKRYVAQAWKRIQMQRNQWQFGSLDANVVIYPRFKFSAGSGPTVPPAGTVLIGDQSTYQITFRAIPSDITGAGAWLDGDASGQLEFTDGSGAPQPIVGETFSATVGLDVYEFVYEGIGSYNLEGMVGDNFEPQWSTFVARQNNSTPIPLIFIPYDHWVYQTYNFATGTMATPGYVSENFEGHTVFLAQTFEPFVCSFVYATVPQILTDPEDVPTRLPEQYHEWIAWEALASMATFDKNSSLFAHVNRHLQFFRNRAETNEMPLVSWSESRYSGHVNE